MAGQTAPPPTNAQIVRLLQSISADAGATKKLQERLARDMERLLKRAST